MGSLVDVINDPAMRRNVVDDCARLLDAEVSDKRGLRGIAVKAAFKTVKGVRPGMIPMSVDALLDDFSAKIDPFWVECQSSDVEPRVFFVRRKSAIAEALLSITDGRASKSPHRVLKGAYNKLRGQATEHIGAAMPRLADLVQKYAS